ncbi:MAG: lipopolysaccharide transport system permease protein [Blastocatellia bacterium]|jgi:lipopolysaccharide transport system permease protein|nr:lipopolysaccharide transport system permease protein [Blastocatellia bacterium]
MDEKVSNLAVTTRPSSVGSKLNYSNTPNLEPEVWTLVIRPKTSWFDLHLADLWRHRDLVMLFVQRDFVSMYKQTILGPLWFIIQPLLTSLTFTLIFGNMAQLSTDGLPKMLFYMSGVTAWNYFSDCLMKTSETFSGNSNLFGKVYFPRLAVPLSIVISNLIRFGIQIGLFLGFYLYFWGRGINIHPTLALLLLPLLVLLMAALGLGSGIIASSLTTRYRDLRFLIQFGAQLLMYTTPVIFPFSKLPPQYRWIMLANPMTPIIETFRYAFLGTGTFSWGLLAISAAVTSAILTVGVLMFNHVERTFMDTV